MTADKVHVGGIGVSGGTADQDEECAKAGLEAAAQDIEADRIADLQVRGARGAVFDGDHEIRFREAPSEAHRLGAIGERRINRVG